MLSHPFIFNLALWVFMLTYLTCFPQKGYDIQMNYEGNVDSIFYIARYHGERTYMADTSVSDIPGRANFKGKDSLRPGIYMLVTADKSKIMEFIVDQEQEFEILLKKQNETVVTEANGSLENDLFFDYLAMNSALGNLVVNKDVTHHDSAYDINQTILRYKQDSIKKELDLLKANIIQQHPDMLLSKILIAMEEVVIPDSLKDAQEDAFKFYKSKYWVNYDFNDSRLLGTPILPNKLRNYFDQLVIPSADAVIAEIDTLVEKASGNDEVRDYLVWYFISEYQNPKYMGLDKVFVNLSDKYFAKTPISNTNESIRHKILDRANQLRNLLIGSQAPNLILADTNNYFVSYNDIDSNFIVLFFWDHSCGFCKQELNELKTIYESGKYDLEVFAIATSNDIAGWKSYIKKNNLNWINVNGTHSVTPDFHALFDIYSTPVIYLLDFNKNIIAKRISVSQLEMFLDELNP